MSVIYLSEWRKKRENTSTSQSQSKLSMPSGKLGPIPIDPGSDGSAEAGIDSIYLVLVKAWDTGFKTKSKFARDFATIIALAATENLITTRLADDVWGNTWLINDLGLEYMKEIEDAFD